MLVELIFFLIVFALIWKWYTYSKVVGLYLVMITLFVSIMLPYLNSFSASTMIKVYLVIIAGLCAFTGIVYRCTRDSMNRIITWLIRLNFGVLIFAINVVFVKALLLFTTITTPDMIASDEGLVLRSTFLQKDVWVILACITLLMFYSLDVDFNYKGNVSFPLLLIAVIVPALFHFFDKKPGHFIETRVILLCLLFIFNVFKHPNVFHTLIKGI